VGDLALEVGARAAVHVGPSYPASGRDGPVVAGPARAGSSATARSQASNPASRWERSQNGFVRDAPQRQSAIGRPCSTANDADFVEQDDELGEIALLVIRARERWRELKDVGG